MPPASGKSLTFNRRLQQAKAHQFTIEHGPFVGYRHREDTTLLPSSIMTVGSQNVLTNVSGRVGVRKGYTLDGQASSVLAPILSSFDWQMHTGDTQHLRAGFLTTAGNDGKLQYRYVASDGTVTWRDLLTTLASSTFNFADFWSQSYQQDLLLFVNGASGIWEWSGGITTIASSTANTLTKNGATTWAEEGFYTTGSHTVVIAGLSFAYTGGADTITLTGVSPNPTAVAISGAIVHQAPEFTANSAMTSIAAGLSNSLIANLNNQIYIGDLTIRNVYVSHVDDYKDYSFTAPVRLVGEGALLTLDGTPVAFFPQENQMYMSAGRDQWYQTQFTLSADLTSESLTIQRLKTAARQGAQSQGLTSKYKNNLVFISFEPVVSSLGRVENIFADPNIADLSFPIVTDMNNLDFTNGEVLYHKNFIYITAPVDSTTLVYNMTNPKENFWEAPQILPIGRLSVIDGDLYGHSFQTSESYKLFDGYNDNGNFIDSRATFAFNSFGSRFSTKGFNEFWTEGYISGSTVMTTTLYFDLDGCRRTQTFTLDGGDRTFVCQTLDDASLGKSSLGKNPLGGSLIAQQNPLPPWFRWIKTFPLVPFYQYQVSFSSLGKDQNWELLSFGPAVFETSEGNNSIVD